MDYSSDSPYYNPFKPGNPVDPGLFVGRKEHIGEIKRSLDNSINSTEAVFIAGEPGIGKTSLGLYCKEVFESGCGQDEDLPAEIYTINLRNINKETVLQTFVNEIIKQIIYVQRSVNWTRSLKNFIEKHVKEITLGGITLTNDKCLPSDEKEFLYFLFNMLETNAKRIVLLFDEIDGISESPVFGGFSKALADINASFKNEKLSLMVMICGSPQSFDNISNSSHRFTQVMKLLEVKPLDELEVSEFFYRAFNQVGLSLSSGAAEVLVSFSHGLPHLMHLVGDATLSCCRDQKVTKTSACQGVIKASEDIGRKYFNIKMEKLKDNQKNSDILKALKNDPLPLEFSRKDLLEKVNEKPQKIDYFLKRLKQMEIIENLHIQGKYKFIDRLTALYVQRQISHIS